MAAVEPAESKRRKMTAETWNLLLQYLGAIFGGLTVVAGALAIITANRISRAQEQRMVSAETRLAEANATAELAKQRAEEARRLTEVARRAAAEASSGAATANERAATLEKEAAEQRERAATAEKALLALQVKVGPRRLTEGQKQLGSTALRQVEGGKVTVICVGGNPEPCLFAGDLAGLLQDSGWIVDFDPGGMLFVGGNPSGVIIRVRSATNPFAVALQEALMKIGVQAEGSIEGALSEEQLILLIGSKLP